MKKHVTLKTGETAAENSETLKHLTDCKRLNSNVHSVTICPAVGVEMFSSFIVVKILKYVSRYYLSKLIL